jgi:hypothetical protein
MSIQVGSGFSSRKAELTRRGRWRRRNVKLKGTSHKCCKATILSGSRACNVKQLYKHIVYLCVYLCVCYFVYLFINISALIFQLFSVPTPSFLWRNVVHTQTWSSASEVLHPGGKQKLENMFESAPLHPQVL